MMDEDDELAEDEEEILVYVEFDGSVPGNTFSNEKLHLDMIGLDKEHPIMQINGKFYEGTYHDAVGTYMFFEKDKNPTVDDPVFDVIPSVKYRAKTRKVLKMHRIFVDPKTEMLGDSNEAECVPNMETIRKAGVPSKYRDAALQSWEMTRNNRMDALNRYLEKQRIREEKRAQGIEPDSESDYDNPFSIYKPDGGMRKPKRVEPTVTENDFYSSEDEETTESKETSRDNEVPDQDPQIPASRDPGPSTSKDSEPWSSPSASGEQKADSNSDDNCPINPPNIQSKKRTTLKVAKKGKSLKKTTKKKLIKKEQQTCESRESQDSDWEETNEISSAEAEALLVKDLQSMLREAEEEARMEADCEKAKELESTIAKRKLEKQQKRDEKMRLVSEKFKKAAEESKLKAQQSSEAGV